jgi:sulfate transport system permease protein
MAASSIASIRRASERLFGRRSAARQRRVLPGFGISLGYATLYLSLIVLIPLAALFLRAASTSWPQLWDTVTSERVMASYRLTFGASFIAALINLILGFVVAWVIVRYRFPGRRVIDAVIDLPFALPTAVSGIALTTIYAPKGWLGDVLHSIGIKAAFSRLGIVIALVFIGLPFVIRTVQPALADLHQDAEEAAASLGATRWQIFRRVIAPVLMPACLTGFALSFARAIGEYGSVVFISGNMPMKTEIASLLIISKLEQYDYAGATAIAAVMLLVSFAMLLVINLLQAWSRRAPGAS